MVDVDVQTELNQVTSQLEQQVTVLNQKKAEVEQLTTQIHNLNGIAMYLRGKIEGDSQEGQNMNNMNHNSIADLAEAEIIDS